MSVGLPPQSLLALPHWRPFRCSRQSRESLQSSFLEFSSFIPSCSSSLLRILTYHILLRYGTSPQSKTINKIHNRNINRRKTQKIAENRNRNDVS
nr:hypothetical protein Iba_chr13aCG0750 [Ipomoea batatas]GMD79140.1 hypothetical protein Iba_chr13dCG0960 [Ipomoea batatas]